MTTVKINDDKTPTIFRIRDLTVGDLFRSNSGAIYVMTDEEDYNGNPFAMLITSTSAFGTLDSFNDDEKVTKLNGTILVDID